MKGKQLSASPVADKVLKQMFELHRFRHICDRLRIMEVELMIDSMDRFSLAMVSAKEMGIALSATLTKLNINK